MMLQNDLFDLDDLRADGESVKTNVRLNAEHAIFKGHFPEQPVLPGVCMLQIVKEITEIHIKKPLRLVKADDLKFLSFVDPTQNSLLRMELNINTETDQIKVTGQLFANVTLVFKFRGTFQ